MAEFFDLSERALNYEQPGKLWSNFGDWTQAAHYPDACEALARRLAAAATLGPGQQLVDLGFGMGEQLRLWSQHYGIRQLIGLNPSQSQLMQARKLELPPDFELHESAAEHLSDILGPRRVDVVVALDCAYHFRDRQQVWSQIADALVDEGVFAWTDLLIPETNQGLSARCARRAMCGLSQIPLANIMREADYAQQLQRAGLELIRLERMTEHVFVPFAHWWQQYRRQFGLAVKSHLKFEVTAQAVKAAAQADCLDYALLVARKSS